MAGDKSIILREYNLSASDLNLFTEDQRAGLAVIMFAVSEINSLARVYLFSSHKTTGIEAIDAAIKIQRNTMLRVWSSKIFEFAEFLKFEKKTGTTKDRLLQKVGKDALTRLKSIPHQKGYAVALRVRNTAAFHYSFKTARKNLEHLPSEMEGVLYLNKNRVNCFFPMGEEVLFVANVFSASGGGEKQGEFVEATQEWLEWLKEATYWVDSVQGAVFREIVTPLFPDKYAEEKTYLVSESIWSSEVGPKVPVFLES